MAESLKNQTVSGVAWSFLERYATQGVSFIITIIMARLLSPSEYGLLGMLAIFISISQVFIDGGFSNALIQKKEKCDEDFSTVFYINVGISLVFYAILFFCAPLIARFFNEPQLVLITRVYTFNLVINALAAVNKTKLTIAVDFKTQLKISLIAATTSGVAGIIAAYNGFGVWALVLQYMLSALLNVVLSFVYVKWHPSFIFSKESFNSLFKFGSKLLGAQLIGTVYVNLYNLAIGKRYSAEQLGYYTRAGQFGQLVSSNLSSIMTRVSFPVLSQVQDDDERLISVYKRFIQVVAFIVFPLSLGLGGIAKPMILSLLGAKWAGSILLLQILSFAYMCDGITIINLNLLYVKGRSDYVLRLEIIKKSIAFAILFATIWFGLEVICIGQAVYSLIAVALNTHYTNKILNYGIVKQVKDIYKYFLVSLVMAVIAVLIGEIIRNCYVALVACLAVCPVFYFGACKVMHLYAFDECMGIAKDKIRSWRSR